MSGTGGQRALPARYDPATVEGDVQELWESSGAFRATEDPRRKKFYCLSMLPYPSGRLHVGHVRNYTIGDVIARYRRMCGSNVLQPMAWDAFGLPAENAAIENNTPPAEWTRKNISVMRGQLKRMGFALDWSREFATCDPEYYRWEQWFFTRLFKKGLVYRANATVNWDPVDQTVLANEQVVDGRGWRSGAPVERREVPQWFLRITAYADELLEGLDRLEGWPEEVKTMQRNWIGRSAGLDIRFAVPGAEPLEVFTTRPDTLMGATYLAVAPEHPLARTAAKDHAALRDFLHESTGGGLSEAALETQEKRGMPLPFYGVHPLSGEQLPIWVANFVLMSYGTGAVMAVPAHDRRDFEFAHKYHLPIRQVLQHALACTDSARKEHPRAHYEFYCYEKEVWKAWYDSKSEQEVLVVNSGNGLDGLEPAEAFERVAALLEGKGAGRRRTQYRLRDWGVSRQRYWGCPIPIIHCRACGPVPVPEEELPVLLPEDVRFEGVASPLKSDPEWRKTACPSCGGPAERETDTFDTFIESSWYFVRYCSPDAPAMVDDRVRYWLPIDQYIGGIEHAVLHLLYARFFYKCMRDEELVPGDEPFTRLLTQGMVVAETYYRDRGTRRTWYKPAEVDVERDAKGAAIAARLRADSEPVVFGGIEKMSKSKNNGVDPESLVARWGADTIRLFSMFAAPPEQSLEWSEAGVEGAARFLRRLWRLLRERASLKVTATGGDEERATALRRKLHQTIAKVTDDFERRYSFNTAIAANMELLNEIALFEPGSDAEQELVAEGLRCVVLMLAPIVPHVAQRLWEAMGGDGLVMNAAWPQAKSDALRASKIELVVQVNGRLRGRIVVPRDTPREEVERSALAQSNVARYLAGRTIRRIIVVPGRLINVVTS